jgi:hypothetical protein
VELLAMALGEGSANVDLALHHCLGIAICLSVAAILLNPISEEGSLDRRIKRRKFAQDAHNLSRAGSLNREAKGIRRIRTSDDVRLLLRRMAVLDVAPDQVNSADPLLFRELQGRCSLCQSRAICACDLAQDAADAQSRDWQDYCPNAAMLGFLSRTAHANVLLSGQGR